MKKASITVLVAYVLILSACQPPPVEPMQVEILALDTEQQKQSYALGASMGQIIENKIASQKEAGIEYDNNLLVKGFIAALQGQSQLDKKEIQSITRSVESTVRQKQAELKALIGNDNKAKGLEFLSTNAKREGIHVTSSGLQYEVLKKGGGNKPKAGDTVKVNYFGTLLDGTEFRWNRV